MYQPLSYSSVTNLSIALTMVTFYSFVVLHLMKIILSLETKREIHQKQPEFLLCFLFTVVFKDVKKSVFFYFCMLGRTKTICVGRESNPGQLLGRQLCSPLYHRRGAGLANNSLSCHFDPSENYPLQWPTCL